MEKFFIAFEFMEGKQIDSQKLEDGKYSLRLVFTSSIDGDLFSGAVGSTLLIDEVELIHADDD
ncbi:PCMD domain-containing protein [Mesonia ostreae]|uniref:PCMD domain-containing protein n=1 Tax=Mesonia ostreae TaxID=861110 RepID=A0ABU2KME2_9FLAO|nr:PCMD domain-containing protein [Mesonia ostreae]MDT0295892.1 PCMD domain-containing protein [Mesonia ostreae]